jgi:hypothetical protein
MHLSIKERLSQDGFAIVENVFSKEEIDALISCISNADTSQPTFRKTNDLFAARQFLKTVPNSLNKIFNSRLRELIEQTFGDDFFVVKSIYFDKPGDSNWFVPYHQDLTISVDKKLKLDGYGPWTTKHSQFAVQPPINILEDNFTIRIHLDEANGENGALRVVPKSHLKSIYRAEKIDWNEESEFQCNVKTGGIMFMKPLLLHASNRTTNGMKRRVIHIEFSRSELPEDLNWSERCNIFSKNAEQSL